MKAKTGITLLAMVALSLGATAAWGGENTFFGARAQRRAACVPWHMGYANAAWGAPIAVVVPPTAEFQTHWGWGVGNTRVDTIDHQFSRNWPGPAQGGRPVFRGAPSWPSDTDQFGYNYVRGPW